MVIAVDGYEANQPTRVGIGRYAYEILRHIYAIRASGAHAGVTFRIYLPSAPLPDMPPETEWWRYRVAKPTKLWTFIGLPLALALDTPKADAVFSPTHYIPRFTGIPTAMAIMDLSYLSFPELFKPKDLHQLVHWTAYAAGRAKRIFTISRFSRDAIIEQYKALPERVVVTYPGLTRLTDRSPMDTSGITKKYGIGKHYILSVGTIQPRKNYVRLIEAFSIFLKENKQKFSELSLVIVGKKGWLYEDILAAPAKYGVAEKVKFLDFVPDEELPGLYRGALCFALPSLYEGFGLPVLEAMAEKCPVVVSDVSSLPEIAGKAGVYVKAEDAASIARGLLTAVRERNLAQGRTRIEEGLKQVAKFTWEEAAKKTLAVLTELGEGNA